jgi:hypothetical protein
MSTTKDQASAALKILEDYFQDAVQILRSNLPEPPVRPVPEPPPDTIGPPYGITQTLMTIFGLNWDGTDDQGDEDSTGKALHGAWGENTHNKDLIGAALPIKLVEATFGGKRVSNIAGYTLEVYSQLTHKSVYSVSIVDLGPAARLHRLIDGTYGLHKILGHLDYFTQIYGSDTARWPAGAHVAYWVHDSLGKPVEIKGVDFKGGRVTGS